MPTCFNKVLILGTLTRDPMVKTPPGKLPTADFGMSLTRHYRINGGEDREETTFLECVAFGRQAEVLAQYCRKGRFLMVEGRLRSEPAEGKQTDKRSPLCVVVESFQFVGPHSEPATQP